MAVSDTTSDFPGYINRFAAGGSATADRWVDIRFLPRKPLQSAELNEMQLILRRKMVSLGDALFKPGGVIDGAVPVMTSSSTIQLGSGMIYFAGSVHATPQATLTIPSTGKVQVGIRLKQYEIDEDDDALLRDQAVGAANYQEPGAGRLVEDWVWGWRDENGDTEGLDEAVWQFYPIYEVLNGQIVVKSAPSVADGTLDLVARYDRESNGNYLAGGLVLTYVRQVDDNYLFNLSAGTANIDGYKIDVLTDTSLTYPVNPDVQTATGESHAVSNDVDGKYSMTLNREPLARIKFLSGVKKETVTFSGHVLGASEEVPTSKSVYAITKVSKGATVYVLNTDYIIDGDNVDWSPGGAEPGSGESYDIEYQYTSIIIDVDNAVENDGTMIYQGSTFIVLSGLIQGTPVNINYEYKLPRIDLVSIDGKRNINYADPGWRDSVIKRAQGVPQRRNPAPPPTAAHQIAIAEIYYDWVNPPIVSNVSIRAVPYDTLVDLIRRQNNSENLIGQLMLKTDRALRDPAVKKGVFVDPFRDDSLRDGGISQTAAINFDRLLNPIQGTVVSPSDLTNRSQAWLLPYTTEIIIEQPLSTMSMRINPYQSFDRPPAQLKLTPNTDSWEENNVVFLSDVTKIFDKDSKYHKNPQFGIWSKTTTTEFAGNSTIVGAYMRQLTVSFQLSNFLTGEQLTSLIFDGVNLTPAGPLTANSSGIINGSFVIPANTPVGTKTVQAIGSGLTPSKASAAYIGQHYITTTQLQRTNILLRGRHDPLAQTFTLPENRQIAAIDIKFTAKGANSNKVFVQIRETEVGFPNQEVLAEAIIDPAGVTTGQFTTATFPIPVSLVADREYAIVILTDDALHALAVAKLGDQWNNGGGDVGFVSEQPYTIGELLSSSNASTWTPHPDRDLCFRMRAAKFTSNTRTVTYGQIAFSNTTDVVVKASVERVSPETDVEFVLAETFTPSGLSGPQTHHLTEDQALLLTQRETGNVNVSAVLKGTSKYSPVVYPNPQFALGEQADTSTYFGAGIQADSNFKIVVTVEVFKPGAANCVPTVQRQVMSGGNPVITGGVYQSEYVGLLKTNVVRLSDGWQEETYKSHPDVSDTGYGGWTAPTLRGVGLDYITRCKLALTGTPRDRIYARNLAVVIK